MDIKQTPTKAEFVQGTRRRPAFTARDQGTFHHDVMNGPMIWDDFLGDVISDQWASAEGSDSGTSVVPDHITGVNGVIRMTTGDDAANTMAANGVQLHSALQWKLNQGNLIFEARVKFSAVTNLGMFIGLTDQIAGLEMPAALSVATYTTDATDCVGFLFDTDATTDTIRGVGVATDVDQTFDSSVVPVLDVYNKYRMEIDSTGLALFYIDDVYVGSIAVAATITVALTPVIAAMSHTTAVRHCDIDYVYLRADRV